MFLDCFTWIGRTGRLIVVRRIKNNDRAFLITTDDSLFRRWQNSGLDKRQFIVRYQQEIDRALIADPVFSGTDARRVPPRPLAPSERRRKVFEALNRIEEATAACKVVPTKLSKRELDRAIQDFGLMWFDVKLIIDMERDATESSGNAEAA